ncbi:MAG: cell division protein FtsL [Hyphomicrobium sp.]|nr:cell division protein FtsL [Hyphomicrobium sp.]
MRTLNIVAAFLALSSAFLLYGLNYDTRLAESRLQERERLAERARSDIAVLRAERAHLARPERIEPMARAQGLEPMTANNLLPGLTAGEAAITTSSTGQ